MPTYVYRREDGTTFELVQRITEDALTTDPETGQRVERVIFGAGLAFKGSGFYLTDYARKPDAAKTEAASVEKAEKAEAKEKPPVSKPEAPERKGKPADTPMPAAKTETAPAKKESAPAASEKKG